MFRSRAITKSQFVAADRAKEDFEPGETLKPYPESGAPEKEYREVKVVKKVDNSCAIL